MPRLCSSLLLLLIAPAASALTMAWTPIGNPGNACDPQSQGCFGSVGYEFSIGTYEVTNSQYAEFLNAKAVSDPLALYSVGMAQFHGGITQSGSAGSYSYTTIAGREDWPVDFVSFYDALRFANWMNNGQGNGDTETGAYTLLGGTETPSNGNAVTRNGGATIFLTSENEWYKAAYFDPGTASYFDYPAGSNTQTTCSLPTATANRANCGGLSLFTNVGSYLGSPSPYGTFDQGGNAKEWNESLIQGFYRGRRGGASNTVAGQLEVTLRDFEFPSDHDSAVGFRLVMIPEPGTGLLVVAGLLGLAGWRRARA